MGNGTFRDPGTGKLAEERRSGIDRRDAVSFRDLFLRRPRRRKSRGRRKTDQGAYVDIYDARTWGIVVAVLALSLLDAILTRFHLMRGSAEEWNPLMRSIIQEGGFPAFYAAKAAMTVFPMAIIMIHKEWALGRCAAWLCLGAYVLLSCYHVFLLFAAH